MQDPSKLCSLWSPVWSFLVESRVQELEELVYQKWTSVAFECIVSFLEEELCFHLSQDSDTLHRLLCFGKLGLELLRSL